MDTSYLTNFNAPIDTRNRFDAICHASGRTRTSVLVDTINLTNEVSKGNSGRIIPLNRILKQSLQDLLMEHRSLWGFDIHTGHLVRTERQDHTSPQSIVNMFQRWYREVGFVGCSSHSGRRTFITNTSRKIGLVGGSLRDVQIMVGHKNLQTTQRYIDYDTDCQRRVVDLV
ncbi:MAG: site-specific integrase [Sphingomonadales bacterium]|nr:site-specific integrase [Sphingomonadales bacterium]